MAQNSFTMTYENTCPPASTAVLRLRGAHGPIHEGSLTITPVFASFGAEVSGLDWSRPIPQEIINQLVELQSKCAVLIFRMVRTMQDILRSPSN